MTRFPFARILAAGLAGLLIAPGIGFCGTIKGKVVFAGSSSRRANERVAL